MKDFHRYYLGVPFEESPEMTALRKLVEKYIQETEAYDRMVCTGPIHNGRIMPATHEEFSLINRNAQSLRKVVSVEVQSLGFTMKDFQQILIGDRKIRR